MSPIWILPPTSEAELAEPTLVSTAADDVEAALARLCEQFKGKPKITALVRALATPAISLRAALTQLLRERGIDDAIGAQLDDLGSIVGQPRNGLSDEDYRRYLRARIAANRSHGSANTLIKIAALVVNDPDARIQMYEPYAGTAGGGGIIVRILEVVTTEDLASIVLTFLRAAAPAGVRVIVESLVALEDESQTFAIEAFASAPLTAGMTTFAIYGNFAGGDEGGRIIDSMFPSAGTIVIAAGEATEETVAYSGKAVNADGTLQLLNVGPLAQNNSGGPAGAHVALADGPGLGLGDADEPGQFPLTREDSATAGTTGGRLVDWRSA